MSYGPECSPQVIAGIQPRHIAQIGVAKNSITHDHMGEVRPESVILDGQDVPSGFGYAIDTRNQRSPHISASPSMQASATCCAAEGHQALNLTPPPVCYATGRKSGILTSGNLNSTSFMNTTGKIQNKGQVTIPTAVRRQAGLSKGDLVNFAFQRGKIVITPRLVIDRSKFSTADDEYTPAQRRIVDAHLAEGLADIKAGRVSKVFSSAEEFIADLHKAVRKRTPRPKTKRLAK